MTVRLITLLLVFSSVHCVAQKTTTFHWLLGTWKLKDKPVYEVWTVSENGRVFFGTSFRIEGQDTVKLEQVTVALKNGSYYYTPDVQGPQGPVDFKMVTIEAKAFRAENPNHDFPKAINYRLVENGQETAIDASIEGDGKTIPYHFVKVQ